MITSGNSVIRTTEHDDAIALGRLYRPVRPRAALLDRRRELLVPTSDELRELLGHKEAQHGALYAIEDRCGALRGFCSLRGIQPEIAYADFVVLFLEDADYGAPIGEDVFGFLTDRAFVRLKLNKVVAQCLHVETAYRDFLIRHGFESEGVQRDVLFAQGRWHNQETLCLFRARYGRAEPTL